MHLFEPRGPERHVAVAFYDRRMLNSQAHPAPFAEPAKVACLKPLRWAPFAGFSVLFDSPAEAAPLAAGAELVPLDNGPCPRGSELALYGALRRALDDLMARRDDDSASACTAEWTFAPLPLASYHVTAWDGINVANLASLHESQRAAWAPCMRALADGALGLAAPAMLTLGRHPGMQWRGRLPLSVQGLSVWGDQVLVARLAPVDVNAQAIYSRWAEQRRGLCTWANSEWGLRPGSEPQLHVSLGYFMQPAGAKRFAAHLLHWEQQLCDAARGLQVLFTSSSVHAFTDMARFYPLAAFVRQSR